MLKTNESVEMYLETILMLSKNSDKVRAIDISRAMNFSKPSVFNALKNLLQKGYIYYDKNYIYLTESGKILAKSVYDKHILLTEFFIKIGANKVVSEKNACLLEHVITDELLCVIKEYLNT